MLCIAHRLHTIIYYDKVLVMEKGKVAAFDAPHKLMREENSLFRDLCLASGDFEELLAVADDARQRRADCHAEES